MKKAPPRTDRRWWRRTKRVFKWLFIGHLIYIVALRWVDPPITITQIASLMRGEGLRRDYVDREDISPEMFLAVLAAEDQLFPKHGGFDWKSIRRAVDHNDKKPQKLRGASTISQQVAKNVFLWQGRSWVRKGLEMYFTQMIEWIWGKKRILEVYVNVIEMGKGVYGAEAAARAYYGKAAKGLTRTEAAQIAACLPNPKAYTVKPLSRYVRIRSGWVGRQMHNLQGDTAVQALVGKLKK